MFEIGSRNSSLLGRSMRAKAGLRLVMKLELVHTVRLYDKAERNSIALSSQVNDYVPALTSGSIGPCCLVLISSCRLAYCEFITVGALFGWGCESATQLHMQLTCTVTSHSYEGAL